MPKGHSLRYGGAVLEFFEIVTIVVYALCALVTGIVAWFERANVKLIFPCFAFLAIGIAPVPTWAVVLMPFLVVFTLLSFRKTTKNPGFDYQKHLLALLDNGTLSQDQYDEESSRISNR
jgi:hypothetical protein